jgi:hypothetical protein
VSGTVDLEIEICNGPGATRALCDRVTHGVGSGSCNTHLGSLVVCKALSWSGTIGGSTLTINTKSNATNDANAHASAVVTTSRLSVGARSVALLHVVLQGGTRGPCGAVLVIM